MLELFEKYKSNGKITEAILVGRNLFNQNPTNEEVFSAYFSYLCTFAETLPDYSDREDFANQANIALAFYAENAILTEEVVETISQYQQRLSAIFDEISKIRIETAKAEKTAIESHNAACLKNLYLLKDTIQIADTQEKLDKALIQVTKVDDEINKDILTEDQKGIYESLTKDHTDLIGLKLRELEYKKNVDYNKQAVAAYASAFNKFRKDENKYKNQSQLFTLASTTLFAFDASRLFNETLIYYNHVYSYIFSKLDDDGKFALTRFSIECERKLR